METRDKDRSDEEGHSLQDLLASYIDRLNGGQRLAPEQVLAEHPDLGPDILEHLRVLMDTDVESIGLGSVRTLGDYTLRSQIGRGGMGVVYEAWQNSMDRRVALKVLQIKQKRGVDLWGLCEVLNQC